MLLARYDNRYLRLQSYTILVLLTMYFDWDDAKSEQLKKDRGFSFSEILELFEADHHLSTKNDDPLQFRAIGWVKGKMLTVIYEDRDGINWLVTYWKSTSSEKKLWEKE